MKDKSPVEKVKDQKVYLHFTGTIKASLKKLEINNAKIRQQNFFRVKLQIASMDRVGLQSLIKKMSTYVRTVHFSRYAIQRSAYKPRGNTSSFQIKTKQKSNQCEGS